MIYHVNGVPLTCIVIKGKLVDPAKVSAEIWEALHAIEEWIAPAKHGTPSYDSALPPRKPVRQQGTLY